MDRVFRIDFYPQDWLIDTARLTLEERGLFIQIVSLIYANKGPIQNDPHWIAGVSGCSTRAAKSLITILIKKGFVQFSGEKITQKRAENELKSKRNHLENSSKGGRKRRENSHEYNEIKDIGFSDTHNSLSAPSPSPSPTAYPLSESNRIDRPSDNQLFPDADGSIIGKKKSGKSKKAKSPSGKRLDDWAAELNLLPGEYPPRWKDYPAQELGWSDDQVRQVIRSFWRYWTGPDAANPLKRDWTRTWENWCDRANARGEHKTSPAGAAGHAGGKINYSDQLAAAANFALKEHGL